ncbi:hypothetical protein ACFORO_10500 [Amycolatopsis halotolerans]|uniref:Uncharacterized protein n=1 Tax=Amycolatopsis halotolerans TaxID=330083 RepID=A0ABV7QCW7_9PSEU
MTPREPVSVLVERWETARMRTLLARRAQQGIADPADYWAELRLGVEIAEAVLSGRWCVLANLLRFGTVKSWAEVGGALGMSETDARDGFARWLSGQVDLFSQSGIGVSPRERDELAMLAEAVPL